MRRNRTEGFTTLLLLAAANAVLAAIFLYGVTDQRAATTEVEQSAE
jgi:hypothetical protein